MKLTAKQAQIYQIVKEKIKKDGFPPTYAEIGAIVGLTNGAVCAHLRRIESKGFISIAPNERRGILLKESNGNG